MSIMPGIDIAEPERTDTSSGLVAPPKTLPVFCSRARTCCRTSSMSPAGSRFASRYARHASVETVKPGGTLRPICVISQRFAPLPPSSILFLPSPSSKA